MIRLLSLLAFTLALTYGPAAPAADGKVTLTPKGETIDITIDGELFGTYHFGRNLPKPFLLPAKAPGGLGKLGSLW